MKRLLLLTTILLAASTASAQTNSLTLNLFQSRFSSASAVADGERIPIGLRSRTGYGIEAAHDFGRSILAVAITRSTTPVGASFGTQPMSAGSLTVTPISATFAVHSGNARVDPYIGAGLAYVMTGNLRSNDLDTIGLGSMNVGNDLTYVINGGVSFGMSRALRLKLDARYMPVSVSATAADATRGELKFKALTIGAGLQWTF
jgi:outer membrane protein W